MKLNHNVGEWGKATAEEIDLPPAHRPQLSSLVRLQLRLTLDQQAKKVSYERALNRRHGEQHDRRSG